MAACGGDHAAITKIMVVPAADPSPGRWDRMGPHLSRCRFADPCWLHSVPARVAGCCLMGGTMSAMHYTHTRPQDSRDAPLASLARPVSLGTDRAKGQKYKCHRMG